MEKLNGSKGSKAPRFKLQGFLSLGAPYYL